MPKKTDVLRVMHVEDAWRLGHDSKYRVFYTGWMGGDNLLSLREFRSIVEYIAEHGRETHGVPEKVDDWGLHMWLNTLGANLVETRDQ